MKEETLLAERLGVTSHRSPLRFRLARLRKQYPVDDAATLEDWLLDVANARGARVVVRMRPDNGKRERPLLPSLDELSNEDLIVAICQPHNRDRPQWLRVAAQFISRGDCDVEILKKTAKRERVERELAALAKEALRVEEHEGWRALVELGRDQVPLADTLLHWTRLAEAKMNSRRGGVEKWSLAR